MGPVPSHILTYGREGRFPHSGWKQRLSVLYKTGISRGTPRPPCPRTTLRKNQPLVPRSNSRITFFTRVVGFSCFWWM